MKILNFKDMLKIDFLMEMGKFNIKMEIDMLVIFKIVKDKVLVNIIIKMGIFMKVNGNII